MTKLKTMNTLLNTLVGTGKETAAIELKIQKLTEERNRAFQKRDKLELEYVQETLQGVALLFKRDEVSYKEINKYILDSVPLSPKNWAFSGKGTPVSLSAIKNWKKVKDEDTKKAYEKISKGAMFTKLCKFESIKCRKFTQGSNGYAVLKKVVSEERLLVSNPLATGAAECEVKIIAPDTVDTPGDVDAPSAPSTPSTPSDILKTIIEALDAIEGGIDVNEDVVNHLMLAQMKLQKGMK